MAENLYCNGQKLVTDKYRDGWMRIWKGHPNMSDSAKKMLYRFCEKEDYTKMLIFFMAKCDYSEDYSYFLIREFVRGVV